MHIKCFLIFSLDVVVVCRYFSSTIVFLLGSFWSGMCTHFYENTYLVLFICGGEVCFFLPYIVVVCVGLKVYEVSLNYFPLVIHTLELY